MSLEISGKNRVIGLKQSRKAIKESRAKHAYIASDAEAPIRDLILKLCEEQKVPHTYVQSMEELGRACKIEVGAAVVVELL